MQPNSQSRARLVAFLDFECLKRPEKKMPIDDKARRAQRMLTKACATVFRAVGAVSGPFFFALRNGFLAPMTMRQERLRAAVINGRPSDIQILGKIIKKHPRLATARFPRPRGRQQHNSRLREAQGRTPLMVAVLNGQLESLNFLIPLSDLEAQDSNGDTAFTLAITISATMSRGARFLAPLSAAGANVNHANTDGRTVLMSVAAAALPELVAELINMPECDANVIHNGMSALTEAMVSGSKPCAAALLRVSSQSVADKACDTLLVALKTGWLSRERVFMNKMGFDRGFGAGALMVSDQQRDIWWRLIDLAEPFFSESVRAEAFAMAGGMAGEKLPMAWARQEAAVLRAEIAAADTPGAIGTDRENAGAKSGSANSPEAPSASRRAARI